MLTATASFQRRNCRIADHSVQAKGDSAAADRDDNEADASMNIRCPGQQIFPLCWPGTMSFL